MVLVVYLFIYFVSSCNSKESKFSLGMHYFDSDILKLFSFVGIEEVVCYHFASLYAQSYLKKCEKQFLLSKIINHADKLKVV